jgi:peroxiredoxin
VSASGTVTDSLRFTAVTIDGKPFDGAALAGRPVVLWFWAAWCPRCRAKAADVAAVARDYAGKVHVVGVAGLGSGDAAMDRFAADTAITGFPNLADDKGEVWRKFGVTTQEYFVLIDKSGAVVYKGPLSGEDLRQRTNALAS